MSQLSVGGTASSDQTICSGATPNPLTLTGNVGTVQWQFAATAAGPWGTITGATSATLSSLQMGNLTSTRYYLAVVTSGVCPSANSNVVIIAVQPSVGGTASANQTICSGEIPNPITLSGNVGTIQWQSAAAVAGPWVDITGETAATLTLGALTATRYYRAVVTSGVCPSANSTIVTITVSQPSAGGTANSDQTICSGSTPNPIALSGNVGTVQWQFATTAAGPWATITGATSATLSSLQMGNLTSTRYYRAEVTNGVCPSTNSTVVSITINPISVGGTASANQTICAGATPNPITLSGNVGTIQWQFATTASGPWTNIVGETAATLTLGALTLTRYYRAAVTSGVCPSANSSIVAITVNPTPVIPNTNQLTDTRCSGDTFVIIPQNGIPTAATIIPVGTTYSWTYIDNPNVSGETNGTNQPTITQVLTNLTNVNQSVQYTVTPLSGTCEGLPFTIVFWVEPKPYIPNVIETVCDGGSFILTPVNGIVPSVNTIVPNITLYSWTAAGTASVSGFTTGTNQSFFNSGILVNNNPTVVQTVVYTVIPTYYVASNPGITRCIGNPFTITVSVNPGVEDNEVITNIACSYSPLCGGSIVLNPIGVAPFTFNWTYTGTSINAITNPTLQNQLNLCPGNYQVEITDALNCKYTFNYVIQPPTPIVSTLVTLQNISCNNVSIPPCDGYIELAITGGTPFATPNASGQFYNFEWYKETPLGSGNFTLVTSGSPKLLNACVGNYKLKVVDANGCIYWSSLYSIQNQFTLINLVENISNFSGFEISCFGANTGYIHDVLSGGSGTYNYVLNNITAGTPVAVSSGQINAPIPTPPGSVNLNFDNLVSGTYQLTITDPFCPNNIVRTYVLNQPALLQSSSTLVSLPVQCFNGTATYNVTATGGAIPYSGTGSYILAAGVHPIVITDANGCSTTQVITVTQPTELVPQVVLTSPILCFGGTAQVTVTASGGTGAYTGTGIFSVTAGGPYNYSVTDANGCTKQVSITVTQPSQLSFVIDSAQNPTCSPDRSYSNGSICITISGGTNPTPLGTGWINSGTNKWCLNNLSAGNYSINVTDINSCASTGVQNVTLIRPTPLHAFINTNIQVNCATATVTQSNFVFASGGTPPYTFTWSGGVACNPANPQCMTTTINGNYIAYVNDAEGIANGCPPIEVPFVVNLIEIGKPSFTASSFASTNCGSFAINDPILFTNTSTGNYASISWFVNGALASNQETFIKKFDKIGDYTVTLTVNYTIAGVTCTYSETKILSITNGYDIVIPNAFTPNGDGINDTIRPVYKCMDKIEMSVYDTWGSLLYFEEGTYIKGWDGFINGKEPENGNYIIVVRATTFAGKDLIINGPVTLIK